MSIPIIDSLKPLGNFPAVNSADVQAGDARLDAVLASTALELKKKANKEYVEANFVKKTDTPVTPEIPTNVSAFVNDAGYLTEQDIKDKADIETVTAVSDRVASVETEQNSLSARMDEFSRLENGSTTGDAELIDGRIGYDGKTYNNIGDAIRNQVGNLRKDLSSYENLYTDRTFDVTNGDQYIDFHTISNHDYQLINNTSNSIAAWVYKSGSDIVSITGGLNPGQGAHFQSTTDGDQIRVYSNGKGTIRIVDGSSVIEEMRNKIDNEVSGLSEKIIIGKNKFNKYETVDGYFLAYDSGNRFENANFCYSESYVPIKPNTTYYSSVLGFHVCFYNKDKSYISGWTSAGVHTFKTPANAAYMRASINIPAKEEYYIAEGDSSTSYEPFIYKFKYDVKPKNYVVVAKDGSGDFTSVEKASEKSPEGTVIYVMPGVYDNEIVRGTWSKKQYIIGTSAQDCIIKNSLGDYSYPPIQIGAGYLENLTFYSEYTGTQERETGATMSYAVHTESDTLVDDNLTIKNCILISDYAPAFGMGMRGGCNVILDNCTLINTYNNDALLFHDADNEEYAGIQNLTVKNCVIYAPNGGDEAVRLQSQGRSGTTVNVELIGNRFKCKNPVKAYGTFNYHGGTPTSEDFLGLINFRLKETSWGNSEPVFNAD